MAQRAKARARAYSCSHARPALSSAALPRVYTRVCACRYTACTLVKIQSEHESAMGTFIVHSYVVLSALHYAIVFSTRPPPALLLIMRITIISLCGRSSVGGRVAKRNTLSRFWYLYTFDVGLARRASVKFDSHAEFSYSAIIIL